MKSQDVLAILNGTAASGQEKGAGASPVTFFKSDDVAACVTRLAMLSPTAGRRARPLTLDPLQMPQVF